MIHIRHGFATLTVVLVIMMLTALGVLLSGYKTYHKVKAEQDNITTLEAYNNAQSGLACTRLWLAAQQQETLPLGSITASPCISSQVQLTLRSIPGSDYYHVQSEGKSLSNSMMRYIVTRGIIRSKAIINLPEAAFISKGNVNIGGGVMITGGVNGIVSGGSINTGPTSNIGSPNKDNASHLQNTRPSEYYFGDGFSATNSQFTKLTCDQFFSNSNPSALLNDKKNVWLVMDKPVCKLPVGISVGNPVGTIDQVKPITLVVENTSGSTSPSLLVGGSGGGTLMLSGLFVFIDKNGLSSTLNLSGSFNITGALITDSGFSSVTGSLTMLYNEVLFNAINRTLSKFDFVRGTWNDY